MPETISAQLYCPECGYDLRGIESGRCPECGSEIDRAMLGVSLLPWRHRQRLGLLRALWRTIWMVCFKPSLLAREMNSPANFEDAVRFRRVVCLLALLPLGILITVPVASRLLDSRYGVHRLWVPDDKLGSTVQLVGIGFLWFCLWLYLLASSGVPSYFYHPSSLDTVRQNRAIALSYYTAAPLAFTPLTASIGYAIFAFRPANNALPTYALATVFLVFGGIVLIQMYLLAMLPARLLATITHRGRAWEMGMSMLISLLRMVLVIPTLVVLPLVWGLLMLALLSLFA